MVAKRSLSIDLNYSKHGSGDLPGVFINTEYSEFFKKKWSYSLGIGYSLHDGNYPLFYSDDRGNNYDGSYRYTTGGIQVAGKIGYSFVRTERSNLMAKLGVLGRYESSSFYDQIVVFFPAATQLPFPVMVLYNMHPQRTISLGGILSVNYSYSITSKVAVGINGAIQTDTNGDTIRQYGLSILRTF
ncbi:hypothetical protein [Siphonobacter sp. SORGH_AS_0500]|uniref:hypothetical protein n=1 Tax=Siphonobacter sp. SORGH_AS_0500 TaxID=1864824 RepID=UPI002866B2CE|nr:hypothetical protein [Siphonobacter sp. SORGH_AS_0500]MDR6193306.1 hypothetical protein [Siphonobacter sp. SORGH_AS_0500]